MQDTVLQRCIDDIGSNREALGRKRAMAGFDAYIDYLVRPIRLGSSGNVGEWFDEAEDLGRFLMERRGRNCSLELNQKQVKLGGNAPNCAHALGCLGVQVTCIAPMGLPRLHPVFQGMSKRCECLSYGEPGLTVSLEFDSSKAMLCINNEINALRWQTLLERIGLDTVRRVTTGCRLLYFLNWGEMPGATDIFEGMAREILPTLPEKPHLLMDLSDCTRRGPEELSRLTEIMRSLAGHCHLTLSLNANESDLVCRALDVDLAYDDGKKGGAVRERLTARAVVIHRRDQCTAVSASGSDCFETRMNGAAVISTGAGDSFNAGLGAAILMGLPQESALAMASMTAGYYVEMGRSPDLDSLLHYMRRCVQQPAGM